jgi:hypothetical protein
MFPRVSRVNGQEGRLYGHDVSLSSQNVALSGLILSEIT